MEATLLLCDWAEEANGKLYIMGGGWSRLTMRQPTANMSLAVRLEVPWDQTNEKHKLVTALITEDGEPVLQDDAPVSVEADFEAGRPPGSKKGSPIVSVFTLRFEGLQLEAGGHRWQLTIDGEEEAAARFEVIKEATS